MAMWEKSMTRNFVAETRRFCPSRAVAFPHLRICLFSLFTVLSTSFSAFPVSRRFCSSVTLRTMAILVDNKGAKGKRKVLHCCYMWRFSWCEGLEALCSPALWGCCALFALHSHFTAVYYFLSYGEEAGWRVIKLYPEKRDRRGCKDLHKITSFVFLRSRAPHFLAGLFLSVPGLTSQKKSHHFSLFTDMDFNKILWWVDPGWMLGTQQSHSVIPLPSRTRERKHNEALMGGDKHREKSPTHYQLVNKENGLPWGKNWT